MKIKEEGCDERQQTQKFVGRLTKLFHSAVDLRMSRSAERTEVILPEPTREIVAENEY